MLHWRYRVPLSPPWNSGTLRDRKDSLHRVRNFGQSKRARQPLQRCMATNQLCYNLLSRAIEFESSLCATEGTA